MAINPNKPDSIVIDGTTQTNTADPKWIDWGPSYDAPTFDIDDPTMWTPMSVISGLASGFCERAAVVSGGTLANNVVWVNATTAARAAIVSKCAANIAKGTNPATIANMYATADATMSAPIVGNTTYMKTTDAMITSLIGAGKYVKADGTDYTGFSDLITQATDNIPTESALQANIVSNGVGMDGTMYPAYPAEWAKQRKWLLDELKYTPGVLKKPTASCTLGSYNTDIQTGRATVEDCRAYFATQVQGVTNTEYLYCGDVAAYTDQQTLGRCLYATMKAKYGTATKGSGFVNAWKIGYYPGAHPGYEFVTRYNNTNAIQLKVPAAFADKKTKVSVLFEQGALDKYGTHNYSEALNGHIVETPGVTVTNATTTPSHVCYEVKRGGVLTINGNNKLESILVSAGGRVQFNNGSFASNCIVLEGGTVTGYPNVRSLAVNGFYPEGPYYATTDWPFGTGQGMLFMPEGASYETPTTDTVTGTNSNRYYFIKQRTANTPRTYNVHGGSLENCYIIVDSGCCFLIDGTSENDKGKLDGATVVVLSGGTFKNTEHVDLRSENHILIYPGGAADITYDKSYTTGVNTTFSGQTHFHFAPGSTVSISIKPYIDGNNYDGWHIGCNAHFYFKQNGLHIQDAELRPSVTCTWDLSATTLTLDSKLPFYNSIIYSFNGNGIVMEGNTVSIAEGINDTRIQATAANTYVTIAGYTEALASIDPDNQPDAFVNVAGRTAGEHYLGWQTTEVVYRCAVTSIDVGEDLVDNYQDFRCRQFFTNPDNTNNNT